MRTRKEIENSEIGRSGGTVIGTPKETLILEVLLDIRELLQNPPIEIINIPELAVDKSKE